VLQRAAALKIGGDAGGADPPFASLLRRMTRAPYVLFWRVQGVAADLRLDVGGLIAKLHA
jgi:hypothetical protein